MKWKLTNTTKDGRQAWVTEGGYPRATIHEYARNFAWAVYANDINGNDDLCADGYTTTKTSAQRAAERALKNVKEGK
jgi:hypothetical protein